jgi:hypothetical protein
MIAAGEDGRASKRGIMGLVRSRGLCPRLSIILARSAVSLYQETKDRRLDDALRDCPLHRPTRDDKYCREYEFELDITRGRC